MIYEIVFVFAGLLFGFLIARYFLSKQKWGDKAKIIEYKWEKKIADLEKEYGIKLEKSSSEIARIMEENKTNLEKLTKGWEIKYIKDIEEIKAMFKGSEKTIRQKSVLSSRRTLVGKFIEKFIPFLSNCPYSPADMHFLGQPIDYIVFEGMGEDNIRRVVFLEAKTGQSKLTKREKSLKEAIEARRVLWKEMRVDTESEETPDKKIESEEEIIEEVYENIEEKLKDVKSRSISEEVGQKKKDDKTDNVKYSGTYRISIICPHCGREKVYYFGSDECRILMTDGGMEIGCSSCKKKFQIEKSILDNPDEINF